MKRISQSNLSLTLIALFVTTNIPCIFANDTIPDVKLSTKIWNGLCRDIITDDVLAKLLAYSIILNALKLTIFACKNAFSIIVQSIVLVSFLALLFPISFANFVNSYILPKKNEQSNIVNGTIIIETKKTKQDKGIERTYCSKLYSQELSQILKDIQDKGLYIYYVLIEEKNIQSSVHNLSSEELITLLNGPQFN